MKNTLALVAAIVALAVSTVGTITSLAVSAHQNTRICAAIERPIASQLAAERARLSAMKEFLQKYPEGTPGIPKEVLIASIERTRVIIAGLETSGC